MTKTGNTSSHCVSRRQLIIRARRAVYRRGFESLATLIPLEYVSSSYLHNIKKIKTQRETKPGEPLASMMSYR
jgi:hypothetical protein